MGIALMSIAIAATSGMFEASKLHMRMQERQLETTEAARAAADMIVRDLRLGGACMPVTGDFISLEGVNNATQDEIITRTGLTRPDLTCVSTVVPVGQTVAANGSTVPVQSTDGFIAGMRVYIRDPVGAGEYFEVASVNSATELGKSQALSRDYPATSGIYTIDERRFYLRTWTSSQGPQSELMLQVGGREPHSFAAGIEKLDIRYQLQRNCPPCDVVNLPATNEEWSIVDAVVLAITARSQLPDQSGTYYRRTVNVNVKPRNLLPR
jgi:hypothetical protein